MWKPAPAVAEGMVALVEEGRLIGAPLGWSTCTVAACAVPPLVSATLAKSSPRKSPAAPVNDCRTCSLAKRTVNALAVQIGRAEISSLDTVPCAVPAAAL